MKYKCKKCGHVFLENESIADATIEHFMQHHESYIIECCDEYIEEIK